jgi:hypothetical protein
MSTIALNLPTWTGPAWADWQSEAIGGIRWVRRATTAVTEYPDPDTPGKPVTVEVAAFDFVDAVDGPEATGKPRGVYVERQPVQFLLGGLPFDLEGARNLIAALTELVEAVEEGTPPASEAASTAIVAVVHDEAARQGIELSIPDPPTVDELKAAGDALGMLPSDIVRQAEDARMPETA